MSKDRLASPVLRSSASASPRLLPRFERGEDDVLRVFFLRGERTAHVDVRLGDVLQTNDVTGVLRYLGPAGSQRVLCWGLEAWQPGGAAAQQAEVDQPFPTMLGGRRVFKPVDSLVRVLSAEQLLNELWQKQEQLNLAEQRVRAGQTVAAERDRLNSVNIKLQQQSRELHHQNRELEQRLAHAQAQLQVYMRDLTPDDARLLDVRVGRIEKRVEELLFVMVGERAASAGARLVHTRGQPAQGGGAAGPAPIRVTQSAPRGDDGDFGVAGAGTPAPVPPHDQRHKPRLSLDNRPVHTSSLPPRRLRADASPVHGRALRQANTPQTSVPRGRYLTPTGNYGGRSPHRSDRRGRSPNQPLEEFVPPPRWAHVKPGHVGEGYRRRQAPRRHISQRSAGTPQGRHPGPPVGRGAYSFSPVEASAHESRRQPPNISVDIDPSTPLDWRTPPMEMGVPQGDTTTSGSTSFNRFSPYRSPDDT